MRKILSGLTAALFLSLVALPAYGQTSICFKPASGSGCTPVSAINPLPTTGGSGSSGGSAFAPGGAFGSLTATASASASTALPTNTGTVEFRNASAVDVSCTFSTGTATGLVNNVILPANSSRDIGIGSYTAVSCINQTGSASNIILMAGGSGGVAGFGGGGSGGGGGSVTQGTDPWLVAGKGTAGTASGGVVTVQGVASMTPFLTTTTLNAETTKVIGTVNQGTSPWVISGTVTATGPLTDTQLRASAVPISGTVTATPTGTQAVSVASGQVASGAVASGAYASGSIASGAMVDIGVQSDAACSTATGTCSLIALTKYQNSAVNSPPPLNLNGTNTAWTGLTPGTPQTGTIVAANVDATSKGGVAYGAMANYGSSPGAVKVDGVNAFVTNTVTVTGAGGTFPATQSGTWTVQPGNTANTTAWLMGLNTTPSLANGNGVVPTQGGAVLSSTNGGFQNVLQGNAVLSATNPSFTRLTDGTTAQVTDPCQGNAKSYLPVTLATAAVKVIAPGVSAKKIYVCAVDLTNNAADSIAVFEATTGTTCATSAVAVVGAGTSVATAATGYNFGANGGISKGNGGFSIWQTTVNNNDLCIAQSAATQLSGGITYVVQ